MKVTQSGQSLTELAILTAGAAGGAMVLWGLCSREIVRFVELVLAVVAAPIP